VIDEGYYLVGDWEGIRALVADLPSDPNGVNGFETAPVEDAPVEDAPAEEAPADEASADENPGDLDE
jgi:hypothetical protein